jgi:hypothetical protein
MKKKILIGTVVLLAAVTLGYAQETDLHGSIDLTFTSKYIWRGFDLYGDKSAIHPSVDLDLFGTGFGVNVMGHRANSDKYENGERWDYMLYYLGSLFQDESYETKYRLGYVYYNYPDNTSHAKNSIDLQELQAIFSWPNILPVEGLVPTYCLIKLWPSNSNTTVGTRSGTRGTASGFVHVFMLDYGLAVSCPFTGESKMLNLHSEVLYNDGVGPTGTNVDQDWSNAVFGVSTTYDLDNNLTLTPGIYHQITMDDSVNADKDETWASLSMTYKF